MSLIHWALAALAHAAHRARHVWTWANWAEVVVVASAAGTAALAWVALVVTDAGVLWAVLAAALFTLGSTVRTTVWNADERFHVDEQMYGMREVVLRIGDRRVRFLYGANGWEEAPLSTKDAPERLARVST